jgi:hypothetical protein
MEDMRSHKWRAKGTISRPAYSVKARRVHVVEAGWEFEKWRLCNSQHNPIDFHSYLVSVGTIGCRSTARFSVYYMVFIAQCHCSITLYTINYS